MTGVRSAWVMGAVGCCFLAVPAQANTLVNWRLVGNRLEFRTSLPTQPHVQTLSDPPRIVVDLPGTVLGRPPESRPMPTESPVRQVRLGQFDPQTTRLVVELYPDYVLPPDPIHLRSAGMNHWVLTLPPLERTSVTPAIPPAVVEGMRVTETGFVLRVRGHTPVVQVRRSPDRQEIWVDVPATLAPQFQTETLHLSHLGILRVQAQPLPNQPTWTRFTLYVDGHSPDWQAVSQGQDIVLWPQKPHYGPEAATLPTRPRPLLPAVTPLVDRVEWDATHQQVLLRANRPLTYSQNWEREAGLPFASLRLVLESVRLSPQAEQALKNIPGLEVAVETVGHQVHLRWRPSVEMRVVGIQEINPQLLAVQLLPVSGASPTLSPLARWMQRRSGATPPLSLPRPVSPPVPRPTPGRPVVVIDPGHGGPDPGAIGIGGLREKDVVMDIAQQVATLLEQQGIQVVMTRTADVDLGLEPRVALARQVQASLFVSIHANAISLSRPDVNGIETYYFHPASYGLAQELHQAMVRASGAPDRGVRQARFYVIRHTPADMPAVLLEVGFVTGALDAPRLASAAGRRAMAQAIAQGIGRYLQVRR
jgi:N-acetylmuramoyl-L-alanine amidase